jgi:hypothetical protein
MADRVSVTIRIGGSIPQSLIDRLAAVIEVDGARLDWEGTAFAAEELTDGEPLALMANEVAWGRFEEIEIFCQIHDLPFVRWSGGCAGSFGPERVVFRGEGDPQYHAVTDDDEVVVTLDAVRRPGSINAIEAHFVAADWQPPAICIVEDGNGDPVGAAGHG